MSHDVRSATDLLRARNRQEEAEALAQPTLAEAFSEGASDGAVTGFVLGRIGATDRPVLWVQDHLSRREAGRLYLAGFPAEMEVITVEVSRPADALRAMEEGLGCPALAAVVGEVWGDPAVLDFTATKRLALRAEAHAVPCWLIRRGGQANLSAARERWRVASLPSLPEPDDIRAPGLAQWQADLFRSRFRPPADYVARPEGAGVSFDHATGVRQVGPGLAPLARTAG